jgi:hypothetical protein
MSALFLTSSSDGVETPWMGMDSLLDALEAGLVDADDYVFDHARQAWQPIRKHSRIVAAWDERMGFRPPEDRQLLGMVRRPVEGFPALSPEGITPISSPAVSRIAARRAAESRSELLHRAVGVTEVVVMVVLVAMLGLGLVWVVRGVLGLTR